MQMHPKAYLQFISRLWHFRALPPKDSDPATQSASPLLVYIVAVLALLFAILEIDLHRAPPQSFGVPVDPVGINSIFMSP
ncbi:hypothetical protein IVB18_19715 [Bradyrhizobium sp. 186]|uniref:hypothetical protein n=1 Tax=Bradyrhizobium sp. 186 TaxID=2782654 RepID=UPI0020010E0C|nr:hypothetical protein [Bradyrhizobium sp. 186]UPK39266.1 hypothetical protein IVB18_19715 [Bradyrhizobium sp. 186]